MKSYQASHPDANFDVKWHPFELDPTLTKTPVNKLDRYASKFGASRAESIVEHMKNTGKGEGINFSYGGTTSNTIDSHRLIEWATEQGKEDEIVEQLFKLYFEDEGNIGDLEELADAAGKIGLNRDEVSCFLFNVCN
jgi:predicted DsbA family dithiol-disulfide isomerase